MSQIIPYRKQNNWEDYLSNSKSSSYGPPVFYPNIDYSFDKKMGSPPIKGSGFPIESGKSSIQIGDKRYPLDMFLNTRTSGRVANTSICCHYVIPKSFLKNIFDNYLKESKEPKNPLNSISEREEFGIEDECPPGFREINGACVDSRPLIYEEEGNDRPQGKANSEREEFGIEDECPPGFIEINGACVKRNPEKLGWPSEEEIEGKGKDEPPIHFGSEKEGLDDWIASDYEKKYGKNFKGFPGGYYGN